jgi:acetyl esterase/lipase
MRTATRSGMLCWGHLFSDYPRRGEARTLTPQGCVKPATDIMPMNLPYLPLLSLFAAATLASGADIPFAPPAKVIALYPGAAPGAESWTWAERPGGSPGNPTIQNVVHPELLYYPADKAKAVGTAMIVAPGGGFRNLMMSYEGVDIAKRLNDMGVDAFVLKYRLRFNDPNAPAHNLPPPPATPPSAATLNAPGTVNRPAPGLPTTGPQAGEDVRAMAGADGQQAIGLIRENAAAYGLRPDRIGIIGFSAGGAVVMRTIRGPAATRPDFAAAIYAADANGAAPPAGAPPIFIAVAADDQSEGYMRSLEMFDAWRKANIPAELHIFQTGRHGFRTRGGGADHFMDRLEEWMRLNGYLTR